MTYKKMIPSRPDKTAEVLAESLVVVVKQTLAMSKPSSLDIQHRLPVSLFPSDRSG